jgi:hypothetical protein
MNLGSIALLLGGAFVLFSILDGMGTAAASSHTPVPAAGTPTRIPPASSPAPAGKAILSSDQLYGLAADAGFDGDDLDNAVAIALAESGGNANAYNPETAAGTPAGKGSFGLWQIYLNANPQFSGLNLFDPSTNAMAAFQLYSQAGFALWSTFKSGAYLAFLGGSEAGNA